jgi:hypothetical protein
VDELNCIVNLDYKFTLYFEGFNNASFVGLEVCSKKVGFEGSGWNSFTFGM